MDVENPLLADYRKGIPRKLELLQQLVAGVKRERSLPSLEALRYEVHKITGNSGTYGYITASDLCKQLDVDLREKIKSFTKDIISEEWLVSLDSFLQRVERAFSAPDKQVQF
ncbi:MAG: hypothetical protein KGZ39_06550 [Simkania sp.]|nr:hypothetical protein [Simkania sp.]